jgi:hypothetical protein
MENPSRARPGSICIEVSAGELLDKLSILRIKEGRITDPAKLANVRAELESVAAVRDERLPKTSELSRIEAQLGEVNSALWDVESELRRIEGAGDFGARFVDLARSVYRLNDRRAALKREANLLLGSRIVEEKEY